MSKVTGLLSFQNGVFWGLEKRPGESVPVVPPRLPLSFRELPPEQAGLLARAAGLSSPGPLQERFRTGGRAFAGFSGEDLACYGWVSQGREWIGEMQAHFLMLPGEGYIWDCVTLPQFRRQGLYTALINHMLRALFAEGLHRVWIGSNIENQPSIRGFQRAGFRALVQVRLFRLLSRRFYGYRPCPGAPQGFVSATRRAFSPADRT